MTDLRAIVFEALDNAEENGYDPANTAPAAVACDLIRCCADLEESSVRSLLPHIEEWQREHRKEKGHG